MARNDRPHVAVLGAGPIGLEAALYARSLGLPVSVYERGRVGEHVQRWGHVRLFSPFGMNTTPLGRAAILAENARHTFPGDNDCIAGREHFSAYLEPLSKVGALSGCLRTETQVLRIGKQGYMKEEDPGDARRGQEPFRLLIKQGKNREEVETADVVLDCTGTYGQHRWLGEGGIPAVGEQAAEQHIAYGLEDVLGDRKNHYAGKNVLVIGAGYSAATTVCNLTTLAEKHSDTWTIWLARSSGTQPLKRVANDVLKERDRLAMRANQLATRAEGNIEFHNDALIESIECGGPDRFKVTTTLAGSEKVWEVERVIANIGYMPDVDLYRELQVHQCYASEGPMSLAAALLKHGSADCLQIPAAGPQVLRNPEPNFYILGSKSYGRNSQFLLRTGFEQVRDVFTMIMGKTDLDLYRKKN
jgi:thioredoxin reductase